jgi:hypothetical protein
MSFYAERVVLVVAGQDDLMSDKIILGLDTAGAEVVRLNLTETPLQMDCCLHEDAWLGTIQAGNGKTVHLDQIGAVLWRWGRKLPGHPAIADTDQRTWAAREDTDAVLGVLRSLPAYWMSHPDRLASVENAKPLQLRDAAQVGLSVPPTLLATHGRAVDAWRTPGAPCIYKAFRAPYKPSRGNAGWVLATRVRDRLPDELLAASIFQELIDGTPIRVTVIGEQIFAVEVTGVDYDVDWRPQQTEADLRPVLVPDKTRQGIHALMGQWGLTYGAFDFIATPAGEWVFLEVNPTGAYGFVEEATGLPLTKTIAETLIRGGRACRR